MKSFFPKFFAVCCIGISLLSCSKKSNAKKTNGIYVWSNRNSYDFYTDAESKSLIKNGIGKTYCKLTDVVWDQEFHASPSDIHDMPSRDNNLFGTVDNIPCIFFVNDVMIKSSKIELEYMAKKIAGRINKMEVKEVQLDCDWSEKSKDNYFYFL
jgi:hypothetical protein